MKIANMQIWVHDQEEALAFYTQKLGMEIRNDVTIAELGGFRWLTVAPAGDDEFALVLMGIPGPPMVDDATRQEITSLMAKGYSSGVFLTTDDINTTIDELKGRGVEFTDGPNDQPYGIDAGFRDPSGNSIRLSQMKDLSSFETDRQTVNAR